MNTIKSGWMLDRVKYQPAVERFARRLMDERRPFLSLPEGAERGVRFNSDDAVMARIESNYTEEEFMSCPGLYIENMLIDAAKSDFWYSYEIDYNDPIQEDNENAE